MILLIGELSIMVVMITGNQSEDGRVTMIHWKTDTVSQYIINWKMSVRAVTLQSKP